MTVPLVQRCHFHEKSEETCEIDSHCNSLQVIVYTVSQTNPYAELLMLLKFVLNLDTDLTL